MQGVSSMNNKAGQRYFERGADQVAIVEVHEVRELRSRSWLSSLAPYVRAISWPSQSSIVRTAEIEEGEAGEFRWESDSNNLLFVSLEATDVAVRLEVYSASAYFADESFGYVDLPLPGHHGIE